MDLGADRDKIVVMRIKRKATEPPLSALVISDSFPPGFSTPKKRRDVLGRARGVFRLADTVPDSWKGSGQEGEQLKLRIERLMKRKREDGEDSLSLGEREELAEAESTSEGRRLRGNKRVDDAGSLALLQGQDQGQDQDKDKDQNLGQRSGQGPLGIEAGAERTDSGSGSGFGRLSLENDGSHEQQNDNASTAATSNPSTGNSSSTTQSGLITPPKRTSSLPNQAQAQYRVVPPPKTQRQLEREMGLPPKLLCTADLLEAAKSHFRFLDAQAVETGQTKPSSKVLHASSSSGKGSEGDDQDPQMAAFQDMLSEYLKFEEASAKKEEEEEYVYDLYYRDVRELGVGGGADVGALLGFDDFSPPSTPSDSEPEDEADEDSNDEDYYRNDYPEDEDADEDMEGYEDAFASDEEQGWSESDEGDGGSERGGGVWDYR